MTAKYELTKLYRKGADIPVITDSIVDFLKGERTTLDHIVTYENQEIIVRAKPKIKDYTHYKLIPRYNLFGY